MGAPTLNTSRSPWCRRSIFVGVSSRSSYRASAGICSDKTGTLNENELTLGDPVLAGAKNADELVLWAAVASRADDADAIDSVVRKAPRDDKALARFTVEHFQPFDPHTGRRLPARIRTLAVSRAPLSLRPPTRRRRGDHRRGARDGPSDPDGDRRPRRHRARDAAQAEIVPAARR
jgi:hypothetical protein